MFTLTSPGNFAPPIICGFNSGQHMIVDASRNMCNEAQFSLRMQFLSANILGPDGCLQYFTGTTGTVASHTSVKSNTNHVLETGNGYMRYLLDSSCVGIKHDNGLVRSKIPNAQSNVPTDPADTFTIGSIGSDVMLSDPQQRPFRMTFQSDSDEVTLKGNNLAIGFASVNELNKIPGGIIGFNLRWTLQNCI
ncbi:hypothetical protein TCAL_11467, partial [Tigriopus californicus]